MSTRLPLNGAKTHPMSENAKVALKSLESGPIITSEFNPGIVDRLLREGSVELCWLPGPYKNRAIRQHLRLKAQHEQKQEAGSTARD